MLPIFPIYKLTSSKIFSKYSEVDEKEIFDYGNGFFISYDGLIATVLHLMKPDEVDYSYYALINDDLYKIKIINSEKTLKDEDYIDAAIGKIDITNCDYFKIGVSELISQSLSIIIKGYSRKLLPEDNKSYYVYSDNYENHLYVIKSELVNLIYDYHENDYCVMMNNFFSIEYNFPKGDQRGLSGSPVINENNIVVGIFKGNGGFFKENGLCKGTVLRIDIINKMILEFIK